MVADFQAHLLFLVLLAVYISEYICVFVSYLDELSVAGECAVEYLGLYQKLIKPTHWKVYLAARGVLPYIGNLITKVMPQGYKLNLSCTEKNSNFIKCSRIDEFISIRFYYMFHYMLTVSYRY